MLLDLLRGDAEGGRVVPRSGLSAWLIVAAAAIMSFLAVLALGMMVSAGRDAAEWRATLALSATVQIDGKENPDATAAAALAVLDTTDGVQAARRISAEEQRALLAPWSPDLPTGVTLPVLLAVDIAPGTGIAEAVRLRIEAEIDGAKFRDHATLRAPLLAAADRMVLIGRAILAAVLTAMAALVALTAQAAIIANTANIRTLRLIGARDAFIVRAFVRRLTLRALLGAAVGVGFGAALMAARPAGDVALEPGLTGVDWIWALLLIPLVGAIGFVATRIAARRMLGRIS